MQKLGYSSRKVQRLLFPTPLCALKCLQYTYNHYNDFQEYLNYYGGWGEMFGNITGGGQISSKYDYNPTPYVEVVLAPLPGLAVASVKNDTVEIIYFFCPVIDKFKFAA